MDQEDGKQPKKPFNEAAQDHEVEVVFESDMDDALGDEPENDLRDNTDPKHDPKNIKNPSLTPAGTKIVFGKAPTQGQEAPKHDQIPRGQQASKERQEELLNGDHTFEQEFNGFRVRTTLADAPSKSGIHGGRIEEMVVTKGELGNEIELAHFKDGDWVFPAETTPIRHSISLAVNEYDSGCLKTKSASQESENAQENKVDKDKGHSR